jgi:NRAMP (natural resistance-associated macrophage protein)-like metal ion transporter
MAVQTEKKTKVSYDPRDPRQPTPPKGTTKLGLLQALGPGLITGASDDDPSGIATYSQVGAQYGMAMLWVMLFSYPLMCGIQEISAQIGRVTGHGIAGNLRRHYPPFLFYIMVLMLFVANTINLGADIGAMGSALNLLTGWPAVPFAAMFGIVCLLLQTFMPYDRYARYLKWLCASLFSYVVVALIAHVDWGQAIRHTLIPTMHFNGAYITGIVAVLGTTISPYLFFWQAEEEVEIEQMNPQESPLIRSPRKAATELQRIRVDTYSGMAFSNIIAFFIILTAAVCLHARGITDIDTATQAADALRPIGKAAFLLFGMGIIGTGLLAVPVLAGSAAYAVGEALKWPVGLSRDVLHAKGFYAVLGIAIVLGIGMSYLHINMIKALFWSAVINGVVAVPIMILMMFVACNKRVMKQFTLNTRQMVLGWAATGAMLAAAIGLFATWNQQ